MSHRIDERLGYEHGRIGIRSAKFALPLAVVAQLQVAYGEFVGGMGIIRSRTATGEVSSVGRVGIELMPKRF
jgi:hypothetical protein